HVGLHSLRACEGAMREWLQAVMRCVFAAVIGALQAAAPAASLASPPPAVLEYRHHMFDPPIMTLANRTIELMFDTARIDASGVRWDLPRRPRALDFTYTFQGKVHRAEDVLEDTQTDALLIIKSGVIVTETYLNRSDEHSHFMSYSMAKSLNSVMLGFALQDGLIASVSDPVLKYAPELKGTAYDGATLRDVLRMRSGSDWDDDFFRPGPAKDINERAFMRGERRFVSAASDSRRAHPPGEFFNYNTVDAAVIGLVIERAVGEPISRYMQKRLWEPAGMETYAFYVLDGPPGVGREFTGGGFNAVLRDYGRLGLLMLQGGAANGHRLLSPEWVKESTTQTATPTETHDPDLGYGYFWWTVAGTRAFTALGGEGQFIFVDPDTATVIVKFSHSPVGAAFARSEAEAIAFFKATSTWQAR
ncbi:MAG TPA: serine hydrolase, partial [Steroidobacteraceae bacterium]|nr:serine hydrolase [Steroidobacteraceae bacterium]